MTSERQLIHTTTYTDIEDGHIEFNMLDEYKRPIGFKWYVRRVRQTLQTPAQHAEQPWGLIYQGQPLDRLEVSGQATRKGKPYGSGRYHADVMTIEEAHARVESWAAETKKRYARKYKVPA